MDGQISEHRGEFKLLAIEVLKNAPYNARTISEASFQKLLHSIRVHGFTEPIIVNSDMTIIGGHQRVKVAQKLGMTTVPAIVLNKTKDEEMALNLSLNNIGGENVLALLVKQFEQMSAVARMDSGFSDDEIAKVNKAFQNATAAKKPEENPIESDDVNCPTCGQKVAKDDV